jgi:hypothetical protein
MHFFSTSPMDFVISNWIISKMHGKEAWKANGLAGMAARDPKIYTAFATFRYTML